MSRGCLGLLGFLGGAAAGWGACILVYVIATSVFGYRDFEGGMAMGTVFMIGPAVGLVTGAVAAAWAARRRGNG